MSGWVKRLAVMMSVLVLAGSSGCISYRTQTQAKSVRANAVPELTGLKPVSVLNAVPDVGEARIGSWIGWRVYGNYHNYTQTCTDTLTQELKRQRIPVKAGAGKTLSLQVSEATARQGAVKFRASATLKVKTGSGLEKQYEGWQNYGNGWATTSAIEFALVHCVEQLLSDPAIIAYLKE